MRRAFGSFTLFMLVSSAVAAGCSTDSEVGENAGSPDGGTLPGPEGRCGDGLDDDGDGFVDEGCPCTPGQKGACYRGGAATRGVGVCRDGSHTCQGIGEFGKWDGTCQGDALPGVEQCNGLDDDCDGAVDEGCACSVAGEKRPCGGSAGLPAPCKQGEQTCGGDGQWSSCAGVVLPAAEVCKDGVDNDCDGAIDDGCDLPDGGTGGSAGAGGSAGTGGNPGTGGGAGTGGSSGGSAGTAGQGGSPTCSANPCTFGNWFDFGATDLASADPNNFQHVGEAAVVGPDGAVGLLYREQPSPGHGKILFRSITTSGVDVGGATTVVADHDNVNGLVATESGFAVLTMKTGSPNDAELRLTLLSSAGAVVGTQLVATQPKGTTIGGDLIRVGSDLAVVVGSCVLFDAAFWGNCINGTMSIRHYASADGTPKSGPTQIAAWTHGYDSSFDLAWTGDALAVWSVRPDHASGPLKTSYVAMTMIKNDAVVKRDEHLFWTELDTVGPPHLALGGDRLLGCAYRSESTAQRIRCRMFDLQGTPLTADFIDLPIAPNLVVRNTGEIDVTWTGCRFLVTASVSGSSGDPYAGRLAFEVEPDGTVGPTHQVADPMAVSVSSGAWGLPMPDKTILDLRQIETLDGHIRMRATTASCGW